MEARTVLAALHFFAEISINQTPGILAGSFVQCSVQKGSAYNSQSLILVLEKLPFEIGFNESTGRVSAARVAVGSVKRGEIHAELDVAWSAYDKTRIDEIRSQLGRG